MLPEIDYLLPRHVGADAARLFLDDVCAGAFVVEHGQPADIVRARDLATQYSALNLGLVDGVVAAHAERLRARATLRLTCGSSARLSWQAQSGCVASITKVVLFPTRPCPLHRAPSRAVAVTRAQ